jgi:hypothetical protein
VSWQIGFPWRPGKNQWASPLEAQFGYLVSGLFTFWRAVCDEGLTATADLFVREMKHSYEVNRWIQTALSNSRNAVSFLSARTTKRFRRRDARA